VSDVKWIKLTTNLYEDEKIKLIDAMQDRDTIQYLWVRLLIQAGKTNSNGFIFLSESIPYTNEMLATIFNRTVESIKLALKTLADFEMIEVAQNNRIKIMNWDKHQNIEGMERVRAQNRKRAETHRDKKKQGEISTGDNHEEEKQNNNKSKGSDNFEIKVQEDQGQNSNASLDNSEINAKVNFEEAGNDIGDLFSDVNIVQDIDVTENKSNVTVTQQNKRENKNKKENKREIETENNKLGDINNKDSTHDDDLKESGLSQEVNESGISQNVKCLGPSKSKNLKEDSMPIAENDINSKAVELMTYYEKITGVVGGLNYVSLKLAIDMHGKNQVKMAIDKALEVNHTDIRYINGILKNWRREGYPKEEEVKKNGVRITRKNNSEDKNEFAGFKPKKPRNLTKDERKGAEQNLI
jgi:predicted phage replisome organizer